ncbi:hypothetical protein IMZ08_18705 [Bacillus luteolus]|uniref:Uncharacterized protein n=1 Tax=Litchfieldia luteola TaxID=682179 RepID=A0ABR9QNJ9_9BACI|nr:hypothetical protein [Cytobacillus luteolus]MBE4910071.1 hypothetical protein [Cytobacillus luteolus]MBP1942366.1 hypothetical protein [Cytobacillus luteolus]
MKKYCILLILFLLIVSAVLVYFFTPLSAGKVFPETKNIERIYIDGLRGDNGEFYSFENIPIEDSDKLTRFSNILNGVEYSRISKSVDILNPYQFIGVTVFYRTHSEEIGHFKIQVNENGLLIVYNLEKTKYKIINSQGKEVFNQIKQFVQDSGINVQEPEVDRK